MPTGGMTVRAIQVGESLDTKGLEREDAFSTNPMAFRTSGGGMAMLFKTGAIVFVDMTPVEEEKLLSDLAPRVNGRLETREVETAQIVVRPDDDDLLSSSGAIQLRNADPNRLLLVGEALAVSVALAYDERRIAKAFERIEPGCGEPDQASPATGAAIGHAGADRGSSARTAEAGQPRRSR